MNPDPNTPAYSPNLLQEIPKEVFEAARVIEQYFKDYQNWEFMGIQSRRVVSPCSFEVRMAGEFGALINRFNLESGSDTPDFILGQFVVDVLVAFNKAVKERERWYGERPAHAQVTAWPPEVTA